MKIYIPNSAFLGNINAFLRGVNTDDPESLTIAANPKWFCVHPVILSMIGCLALKVPKNRIHVETLESKSKHYLQRMGVFHMLGIEPRFSIVEHEASGRFVPLTQITNSQEQTAFIRDMIPLLHLTPQQSEPLNYVVSELVRNVLEHANSTQGAMVCAQYYKKNHIIRIGIADAGIGIRRSIARSHIVKNDIEAIQLALTPGITGTTPKEGGTESNAGAGLFFIRSIAKVNRNFLVVYSGNALYKLLQRNEKSTAIRLNADPFNDRHSIHTDVPYWQGTVVGIDISLDHTQAFSVILDMIRTTYVKSVRERKKQKHKQPRFIP